MGEHVSRLLSCVPAVLFVAACGGGNVVIPGDDGGDDIVGEVDTILFFKEVADDGLPGLPEWSEQEAGTDGTVSPQPCEEDDDCSKYDDGDLCNGKLVCADGECAADPDSAVVCEDSPDPCKVSECDPESGGCIDAPGPDGIACDDGNICTEEDSCLSGVCAGGAALDCDDGNPCTADSCDLDAGCVHQSSPGGVECDDENPCTVGDSCVDGECFGGGAVNCDDGNPCTDDACSTVDGCIYKPNDLSCDDGDPCTEGDFCAAGQCTPGPTNLCEGCQTDADCVALDDGNLCNGAIACLEGKCALDPNTVVVCDNGADTQCAQNTCNPGSGNCEMVPVADDQPCDDGNVCTNGDVCITGVCVAGELETCDDGDACTEDWCEEGGFCMNVPIDCDDNNPATIDTCDQDDGCIHTLVPCNDNNLCTQDLMDPLTGDCVYFLVDCDDGDTCTVDECQPAAGCVYEFIDCDDGNACTDDSCAPVSGDCEHINVVCDDDDACTDDSCDPGTGCLFADVDCDDKNDCTIDLCDSGVGCAYAWLPLDGEPCDDGDECTEPDICSLGDCLPGEDVCVEDCNNGKDDDKDWLVDCLDPDCTADPACAPSPECDVKGDIVCGDEIEAKLANGNGDIDEYSCADGDFIGNERIYEFVALCPTAVTATVTTVVLPWPGQATTNVFILDGAEGCTGDECIAVGEGESGDPGEEYDLEVTFDVEAGHKYYIVVDGGQGGWWWATNFTLKLECTCPDEVCDNGIDDDSDGDIDCDDPDCKDVVPCKEMD